MNTDFFTAKDCPNLVAEILAHNFGSVHHLSKACQMDEEELYAFLKGEVAIGVDKLNRLASEFSHLSNEYLKCKRLSYYNLDREKHRRKLLVLAKNHKYKKLVPLDELAKRKIFLRAWYNSILLNEKIAN